MYNLFILVNIRGTKLRINYDGITYIERNWRKTRLFLINKSYEYYENMDDIINKLDDRFYTCHKSLVINLEQIHTANNDTITFLNGDKVSMSEYNLRQAKKAYKHYLERKFLQA